MTSDWNASSWHHHYLYFAALSYFYAPHHHFAFFIQSKFSNVIKGRAAPWATERSETGLASLWLNWRLLRSAAHHPCLLLEEEGNDTGIPFYIIDSASLIKKTPHEGAFYFGFILRKR